MRGMLWGGYVGAFVLALSSVGCGYGPPSEAGACPFAGACQGAAGPSTGAVVEAGFVRSGTGDAVVQLPATASAVRVTGKTDFVAQAFLLQADGRLLLNAVLQAGTPTATVQGTYLTAGGATLVIKGQQVQWTVTTVLVMPPPDGAGRFEAAGRGAAVLAMPQRSASFTFTASTGEVAENVSVWVGDRLAVNAVIGSQVDMKAYTGVILVPAGAVLRITGAEFADWRLVEGG